jgi:hypothetical protein
MTTTGHQPVSTAIVQAQRVERDVAETSPWARTSRGTGGGTPQSGFLTRDAAALTVEQAAPARRVQQ